MENYKQASREDLRIQTTRGELTVSQLWHLPITELDVLAVKLEADYNESGKKSFVVKRTKKDSLIKLRFDIVLDILTTKVEEAAAASESLENNAHNSVINALIAEKQTEALKGKSIKELEKC